MKAGAMYTTSRQYSKYDGFLRSLWSMKDIIEYSDSWNENNTGGALQHYTSSLSSCLDLVVDYNVFFISTNSLHEEMDIP